MSEPRTKKTTLACDSCRKRKRKCDGKTPVCSLCEKGNYQCVYDATQDQRRPAQKSYVAALEARVAQLEAILKKEGAGAVIDTLDLAMEQGEAAADAGSNLAPILAAPAPRPERQMVVEPEPSFVPSDEVSSALQSVSLVKPQDEATTGELDLGMSDYVPLVSLAAEHKLLVQYWDWQRMHLPYVSPVPFLSAYALYAEATHEGEPIPAPPPPAAAPTNPFVTPIPSGVPSAASVERDPELVQYISPLLLDAMFAISALFNGDRETSERFHKRAESRLLGEATNPKLATVQGVLIMATWELGHARAPATWTLLGVSCALSFRLGMHIDGTPLVKRGIMSQTLFETRNFVFWAVYNKDRFCAICMGMHPLMDRRMISTPHHSSLSAANNAVEGAKIKPAKPTASKSSSSSPKTDAEPARSDPTVSWWNPSAHGMGEIVAQAGWEAIRDLIRMTDALYEGIYSFDAPKRTPQEDLDLVTANNLTIQRFIDELPTWLRSTGVIRRKENGFVYLHLFTHLTSIVASRPFLSPRPLSEEAMIIDSKTTPDQPNHSSHIIRRYRTLAFRVARASALQIINLIRHIPLSSPCVTLPYVVYSASTVLLLAPNDAAAMDAVKTGIACLERLDESGYWVNSARDAIKRVRALAVRWGVTIGPGKKMPPLPAVKGSNDRNSEDEPDAGHQDPSSTPDLSLPSTTTETPTRNQGAAGSSSTVGTSRTYSNAAPTSQAEASGSNQFQQSDRSAQIGPDGLPSYEDAVGSQTHNWSAGQKKANLTTAMVQPDPVQVYRTDVGQSYPVAQPDYSQQPTQYQPQHQHYPQQPVQHVHLHFHAHTHANPGQEHQYYQHASSYQTNYAPHVGFGSSHADPRNDFNVPHTHWHQILPPVDPNLPFPPDATACTDMATCFADTVRTTQDPMFVQDMTDPYASLATEWFSDSQDSFALITPEMYGEVTSHLLPEFVGNPNAYGQVPQAEGGYGGGYHSHGAYA